MNFYSHYHFFHLVNQSEFNTGLILPDLVKNATGQKLKNLKGSYASDFIPLLSGCRLHIETDKWFHSSDFFKDAEAGNKINLKESGFSDTYPRSWFVNHVMCELMLDRILIKSPDETLDSFYNSLATTDENILAEFLILNDVEDTGKFLSFLKRFRESQYMYTYTDDEKFIYALGRICQRVGLPAFGREQLIAMLKAIPSCEVALERKLTVLNDDLATFHVNCDN